MKFSFFLVFLIFLVFSGCGLGGSSNPEASTIEKTHPSVDSLKKDLIAYDKLVELEINKLSEFRERYIEMRSKLNEVGLEKDTTFQIKMHEYKTFGSKMDAKAKMALTMMRKRRVELVSLKTPPTDELKVLCIRAIEMGKETADLMIRNKEKIIKMENEINLLIDSALKK